MAEISTYYLIDYENTGVEELEGISKLPKDAQVHLFSTRNSAKISTRILPMLIARNVQVHEVSVGAQSVDKHLVSYLGYLIASHGTSAAYIIVSKDKGYDNIIQFWKGERGVIIHRQGKLKPVPKAPAKKQEVQGKADVRPVEDVDALQKKEHQIRCFFGQHFKEKKYQDGKEAIIAAVLNGATKTQVNTMLTRVFPSDEVKIIYARIKPLIDELPGQ